MRFAASAFLSVVIACSSEAPAEEPCPCTQCGQSGRCLVVSGCRTSADCPAGTVCAPYSAGGFEFPEAPFEIPAAFRMCIRDAGLAETRCVLAGASGSPHRTALIDGFAVAGRELRRETERVPGPGATFSWDLPPETSLSVCAIFRCPPVVARLGGRRQIVNEGGCLAARKVFEPAQETFSTADLGPWSEHACDGLLERIGPTRSLLLGCWAYDQASLSVASTLSVVVPDDVPYLRATLGQECDSASRDGHACILSEVPLSYGTCRASACVPVCVSEADCDLLFDTATDAGGPSDAGVADGGVARRIGNCIRESHEYVGHCEYDTP